MLVGEEVVGGFREASLTFKFCECRCDIVRFRDEVGSNCLRQVRIVQRAGVGRVLRKKALSDSAEVMGKIQSYKGDKLAFLYDEIWLF